MIVGPSAVSEWAKESDVLAPGERNYTLLFCFPRLSSLFNRKGRNVSM